MWSCDMIAEPRALRVLVFLFCSGAPPPPTLPLQRTGNCEGCVWWHRLGEIEGCVRRSEDFFLKTGT